MAGTDASNAVNVDSSAVVRSWPMILGLLTDGSDLSEADSRWAMGEIMSDNATSAQIAAFGVGLKM
jgi:anthranilate phosphoribosyltransferase